MRIADLATRLNVLQLAIWTSLALWVVPSHAHFLYDEAYFYHQAIQVARHAAFPVYGPPISGTMPTAFTPGGTAYVLLGVPFLFGTDPRLGTAWLILLSSLAVLCLDQALKTRGIDSASRVFTVAVLTWSTWHARLVDRIWNNHVEWPLAIFLLAISLWLLSRGAARSRGLMIVFGFIAAILMQAHLQGTVAIAACAALIFLEVPAYRRLRPWIPAALACAALYLPYALSEATRQFRNTGWLAGSGSVAHGSLGAVLKGALSPLSFQSLFPFALIESRPLEAALSGTTTSHWVRVAMSLMAIAISARFLFRASPLRRFVLLCWILVPVYFLVIRREYHDHYVYSLAPFFIMPLGLALGELFRRRRAWAVATTAFLLVWIGVHTEHWVPEYLADRHRPTLMTQLRRAEVAAKRGAPLQVRSGDPDVFIVWALARDDFGRELLFYADDLRYPCRVAVGPRRSVVAVKVVSWDSYFACP